ncbi:MAG: PHB depolymerase family esterase [Pseudomonadota bacterium]|uniref:extracellular catalytic domain type 1 short-chain-length polyhydroxyalkanoate depolymerase n=1 Tax=Sphingobium naphthae TaxID=1886786 RepID=UPI002B09C7A7|nr:PHB depolymerase family esterase [Pseudomonadota bacterium]
MTDLLKTWRKARRLVKKRHPLSAALAFQDLLTPPFPKPARKRAKAPRAAGARYKPTRPAAGSFISERHDGRHGALAYRLYTPTGSTRRRLPLVVMLHGCTQTAEDFAIGTRMNRLADELGFLVLYPEQSQKANFARCWNWHAPENQGRGSGEAGMIAALTRHVVTLCNANRTRVYIAGISAGGAMAAIVGAAYPDLFVAVGVHSGVPRGDIRSLRAALAAMQGKAGAMPTARLPRQLPTIVFHGDQDKVVHPSNAGGFLHNLERAGMGPLTLRSLPGKSDGGRDFSRRVYQDRLGTVLLEDWTIHGSGHSWSGGSPMASHTDPGGPDASREMLRFFLARRRHS